VTLNIDFERLARDYTKVFYYDAVPIREDGESEGHFESRIAPTRAVFEAAASVDRVHVYEGDARRRRRRGLIQKKVDVMLTVDMLMHSFRKNMHQATLLTGDNDFKPLVDALVQDGMFVTLLYPPDETSRELMQAADARIPLTMDKLSRLLTQQSRQAFAIPVLERVQEEPPSPPEGAQLCLWDEGHYLYGLYRSGEIFEVVRDGRPFTRHRNFDLLKYYCRESLDITIPDDLDESTP
jgi:uncharacterized LabA/DUF88 family protein